MNIVFWILVILVGVLIWLFLSDYFFNIGSFFFDIFEETKDNIHEDELDYENEEEQE